MSNVNSHVQIPKFILKNFEDKKQRLFYYDFKDKKIKTGHAATLNTVMGYYSEEIENFLSNIVEQPFSKFVEQAKKFKTGELIVIDEKVKTAVFRYLYSLMTRGTVYLDEFLKESKTACLFQSQDLHDFGVHVGITGLENAKFFQDSVITLGINNTNTPLLLPNIGYCECDGMVIMPITPAIAVVLVHDRKERVSENGKHFFLALDTDESVFNLNYRLFINEMNNVRYVTATNKHQLEKMVEKLKIDGRL